MDSRSQQQLLEPVISKNIRYGIRIIDPTTRDGRIGKIYAQSQHNLLSVPEPLTVHSSAPDVLAGVWAILRETLLCGYVARGSKETIATVISSLNECP